MPSLVSRERIPTPQSTVPPTQPSQLPHRPQQPILGTMSGTWILDKSRGSPSMRGYLETMNVTPLAIEAHEKGEADTETIHVIELTDEVFKIRKLSRVNDLEMELRLGVEERQILPGGEIGGRAERVKTMLATSDDPGRSVRIVSRMPTMNGIAHVVDSKSLKREGNLLILIQTLTITNEMTGKEHTTVRYFVPYEGEIGAPAATAKGSSGRKNSRSGRAGSGGGVIGRNVGEDMDDIDDEEEDT